MIDKFLALLWNNLTWENAFSAFSVTGFLAFLGQGSNWLRERKSYEGFLSHYTATMTLALAETENARAEIRKHPFNVSDLRDIKQITFKLLNKEAGALLSVVIRDFDNANNAIQSINDFNALPAGT